jgi:hypothetical protein
MRHFPLGYVIVIAGFSVGDDSPAKTSTLLQLLNLRFHISPAALVMSNKQRRRVFANEKSIAWAFMLSSYSGKSSKRPPNAGP